MLASRGPGPGTPPPISQRRRRDPGAPHDATSWACFGAVFGYDPGAEITSDHQRGSKNDRLGMRPGRKSWPSLLLACVLALVALLGCGAAQETAGGETRSPGRTPQGESSSQGPVRAVAIDEGSIREHLDRLTGVYAGLRAGPGGHDLGARERERQEGCGRLHGGFLRGDGHTRAHPASSNRTACGGSTSRRPCGEPRETDTFGLRRTWTPCATRGRTTTPAA